MEGALFEGWKDSFGDGMQGGGVEGEILGRKGEEREHGRRAKEEVEKEGEGNTAG